VSRDGAFTSRRGTGEGSSAFDRGEGKLMPVQPYVDQLEPQKDAVIWRFMDMPKFRDLMASEELYFCRADLFDDTTEGLPPDEYALPILGLNRYDVGDQLKLDNLVGSIAQFRESYYISCWYLFRTETLKMWNHHAREGVAICSRYELLKSVLGAMLDTAHVGLVQYGIKHLSGFNTLRFITTKQQKYEHECEVRAFLHVIDPLESGNRHIDVNNVPHRAPLDSNPRHVWVPTCKRRRIDLNGLLTGVVISPWASEELCNEVELWVKLKNHSYPVRVSELKSSLTPAPEDLIKFSGGK
jgi:hypothetical protein